MNNQKYLQRSTTWLAGLLLAMSAGMGCGGSEITAQMYHSDDQCWGAREVIAEDADASGCDTETVIATDSEGNYWRFPDSCVPDDFERVDDPDVIGDLGAAPNCAS